MATQSVKIPVELQIQQIGGQIAELKRALKGVKPESAAWSKLNGTIEKLESKFYALERHSRQAFSSTSEIKAFKREFDRLVEGVDSAADGFKGLKFKDLQIDSKALEGIQKIEKQIEKLKESFHSLEAISIQELINGKDGNRLDSDIKNLGLTKIPDQYDELIKAIEKKGIELSAQQEKLSRETEKIAAERDKLFALFYEPYFMEGSDTPAFFDENDLLQVSKLKELFNKYNQTINFEKGKLKKNIEQELSFDLVNLGFKKSDFEKLFSGIGQAEFENSFNTLEAQTLQRIENLKKTLEEKVRESRELTSQQKTVGYAKEEASEGQKDFETKQVEEYRQKIEGLENQLRSLKQQQVAAASAVRLAGQVSHNTAQIQSQYTQQIAKTEGQLRSMEKVQSALTGIENGVKQWFGFNEVINLTKRVVRDAITEIKELDSVMTEIAVVTDMTQADLWAQMGTYGAIAEQYGVSTRGVYEVSQLWYQQGLQTAEVMNLTTETLKMAKIANLDYATATDYMTVALRGFKLEMTEAQNVTDVYSALAAATASDTEELAIAMSKTASSAEAVGASFESTSAMIATMISITREAPENIGSALKSIISRYGEMTSDPLRLIDSEGEEMSLNKVDKALQSVGISLQDANGQFRAFDDVILELAESWDTIDTNTQRYIATIMAGNRQQSRFLALVGNVEAYKDALETAANAEDAGTLQYLKTMDSLETKLQQVKTAWTQFYSSMGLEELFKGALDIITNIIQNINKMGKADALINIVNIFLGIRKIVTTLFKGITNKLGTFINNLKQAKAALEQAQKIEVDLTKAEEAMAAFRKKQSEPIVIGVETVEESKKQLPLNNPNLPANVSGQQSQKLQEANQKVSDINTTANILSKVLSSNFMQKREQEEAKGNQLGGGQLLDLTKGGKNNLAHQLNLTVQEVEAYNRVIQQSGIQYKNASQFATEFSAYLDKAGVEASDAAKALALLEQKANSSGNNLETASFSFKDWFAKHASQISTALMTIGTTLSTWALTMEDSSSGTKEKSKIVGGLGTAFSSLGTGISTGAMIGGPWGAAIGAIAALPGVISGLSQVIDGWEITTEERIAMLTEELQKDKEAATVKKGEELNLKNSLNEFYKLEEAQYDSAEAAQAFTDKMNAMGEQYPRLIESMDASGNAIIDAQAAEQLLAEARYDAATAALKASETEYQLRENERKQAREGLALLEAETSDFSFIEQGWIGFDVEKALEIEALKRMTPDQRMIAAATGEINTSGLSFADISASSQIEAFLSSIPDWSFLSSLDEEFYQLDEAGQLSQEAIQKIKEVLNHFYNGTLEQLNGSDFDLLNSLYDVSIHSLGGGMFTNSESISLANLTKEQLYNLLYNPTNENGFSYIMEQLQATAEKIGVGDLKEFMGWGEDEVPSADELYEAIQIIKARADQFLLSTGDALLSAGDLFEKDAFKAELAKQASLDLSQSEYINNYSPMLEQLGTEMTKHFLGIGPEGNIQEYARSEDQEVVAQYNEAHDRAFEQLKMLIASGSEDFVNFYNNLNSVRDVSEIASMVESLGFTGEEGEAIYEALVSTYSQYTDAARKRAIAAIQGSENLGSDRIYFSQLFNQDSGITELTSQYSDHVVKTVKQIDDYAERGLSNRANLLTSVASDFYNELGQLDGETQGELFGIVKNINWSDASSIAAARTQLEDYISNQTGDTTELEQVLSSLEAAQEELFFNVTSTIESYRQAIIDSIEGTTENYSGLTDGFEIGTALEKFSSLTAVAGYEDFTFDQLFTFDKELGKYVYSLNGFKAAMKVQQDKISEEKAIVDAAIANVASLAGEDGLLSLFGGVPEETDIYSTIQADGAGNFIQDYFELPDNLGEEQLAALEDIISHYNPQIHGSFEDYLTNYVNELQLSLKEAEALNEAATDAYIHQLKSSIDFGTIADGTTSETQKNTLITLIKEQKGAIADWYANFLAEQIIGGNYAVLTDTLGSILTYEDKTAFLESQTSNFSNAISAVINEPGKILGEAEGIILNELGLAELKNGVWYAVSEARDFTKAIEKIVNSNSLTLQEANQLLADIYTEQNKAKATKADFSSKTSLNYSDLAELATLQGEKLTEEYITSLGNAITQDSFTGNFEVVDFDAYWTMLHGTLNKNTAEYLEAYSNWTEEQISKNSQIEKGAFSELESLMKANIGEQLSVVYLESIIGNLSAFGLDIQNGIATITDDTRIYDLVQAIINAEDTGSTALKNSITSLKDSLNEMFSNWANLISSGIEGNLDYAGAEQLMAQFDFLSENDFAKTQEGLKLSRNSAFQLYQELKKIDSIKAGLVFDSLAESLADAGDGYEDVTSTMASIAKLRKKIAEADDSVSDARLRQYQQELATAEEILKVRSEDPDSYNFMDEDLGVLEGPLNYWNNVGEGFKALNEGVANGYMDVQDYVNIIRETASLVEASGQEFEVSGMDASQLIQAGLNAMENIDGEGARINIEGLGINFANGTESLKGQFNDGIANLAESQIEMIDAQIQLLETIVAMEEISNIDVDGDGIELGELFDFEAPDGTFDSWDEVTGITKEHQDFLLGLLEESQNNEKLKERLEQTLVNGKSLYDIVTEMTLAFDGNGNITEKGKQQLQELGLSVEQYLALMKGIEHMVESGDYDLESVLSSVSEQLSQGFSGSDLTLDFGGKTLVFTADGLSYEIDWGENGELANSISEALNEKQDETSIREAINRVLAGTGTKQDELIFQIATKQIKIQVDEETGEVQYITSDGTTIDSSDPNALYKATLHNAIAGLEQIGATGGGVVTEEGTTIPGATAWVKMGETEVKVQTSESGTLLHDPVTGAQGATPQEFAKDYAAKKGISEGEARVELGIPLQVNLEQGETTGLDPTTFKQAQEAYLTGNDEGLLEVGIKFGIIPEGTTVEEFGESGLQGQVMQALESAMPASGVPVPVTISFEGVTAEEAISLSGSISTLTEKCASLNGMSFTSLSGVISALQSAFGEGSSIVSTIDSIKSQLAEFENKTYTIDLVYNVSQTGETNGEQTTTVSVDDSGAAETLNNLASALLAVNTSANTAATSGVTGLTDGTDTVKTALTTAGDAFATAASKVAVATGDINRLADAASAVPSGTDGRISAVGSAMSEIPSRKHTPVALLSSAMNTIPAKKTMTIDVKVTASGDGSGSATGSFRVLKTGNVALAKGNQGPALASGRRTLMGELGPELVVSDGRYFTVGNNGAEFVDLPDDAIVFNHLQTKKLLGSGGMVGTGEPVTNERKATALAGGNVSGPAMASAKEALNELYALRAMWASLLDATGSDLGKKAGRAGQGSGKGPGGGGGGGGGSGSGEEIASVVGELDRWYNLLRQIAKLEQQITMEQAKRENMRSGYDINDSLEKELKLLQKQYNAQKKLSEIQKSYYDARRADLDATDYSKIFTYDEDGLMQYVDGQGRGLDILATLNKTDKDGKAIYNAKEQLDYLKNVIEFDTDVLKTNADGTKAEDEEQMMQNFWDGIDSWMEEMDSLYDSYNDAAIAMEEATTSMNEILNEQIQNQLTVEEKLMKALEAREQAEIDRIQEEKEALEEAAQEYIDGLNTALEKERSMYDKNETDAETSRLQRQLAILQRSGGSASEIKSLQDQIDSRLKDAYFEEQQNQIDAIQEASDNQLEKLQTQIDIMTETLEYQKENGLLWNEIHEMMQTWTPEAMLEFIETFDPDYKTNSATQNQQNSEETLQQIEQWVGYNDDNKRKERREGAWDDYYAGLTYDEDSKKKHKEGAKKAFNEAYGESEDLEAAKAAADKYYKDKLKLTDSDNGDGKDDEDDKEEKITGKGKVKTKGSNLNVRSGPGTKYGKIGKLKNKSSVTLTGYKNGWYQIDYNGKTGYVSDSYISTSDKKKLPAFKSGGLVDFTGPAWVDGSKSKPEAFLSAKDTAMLKSKIFSNSDGSLRALVATLEAITSDTSKYSAQTNTESIIIQNAQVNIQPGTISNDYDARRAGEIALEEMVKIARKTTNRVVSR